MEALLDDTLLKVRYIRKDVDCAERATDMMEEVNLLDKKLRVAAGEMEGAYLDADDLTERRRRMEGMVRRSMEYDSNVHATPA